MAGGPWNYLDCLIVLESPEGIWDHTSMAFDKTDFWIQIHNLPIICLNREAGLNLGSQIGEVIEVDPGASGDCLGKYMRVRVTVDITKPLKRGLKVKVNSEGAIVMALLRYERLPEFCFKCGIIGHPLLECDVNLNSKVNVYKYNELIRAGPIGVLRNKGKKPRSNANSDDGGSDGGAGSATQMKITEQAAEISTMDSRSKRLRSMAGSQAEDGGGRKSVPTMAERGNLQTKSTNLVDRENRGVNIVLPILNKEMEGDKACANGKSADNEGIKLVSEDLIEIEVGKVTEIKGKEIMAQSNFPFQKYDIEKMGYLGSRPRIGKKGLKATITTISPKKKIGKSSRKKMLGVTPINGCFGETEALILRSFEGKEGDSSNYEPTENQWINEKNVPVVVVSTVNSAMQDHLDH
ncbi:uncharacterized protein LOC126664483 isoform X2 [Mercurialis annua]|nr:uncharacterized protein LOC126664483 isoform X2 [Mercurialis annua]XP_050212840.1 uncharacterized protein LOC126664483 isoform X2 [Mercurialis annua]